MSHCLLVDAATLLRELAHPGAKTVVVDTRFDLADTASGERQYRDSHVPGSFYLHLDRDLSAARTGRNGRHPLPERAVFARTVGALGIAPDTPVVALDAHGGVYAARLWWMLRWLGHDDVALLDGGIAAWQRAGGPLTDAATPATGGAPYPDRPSLVSTIDADGVATRAPRHAVVDARAPERFRGEVEPIDAVGGHVPGALNRFHRANLDDAGAFRSPAALHDEFGALLGGRAPAEIIHSCGSGVTACHNLFAMELAGLPGSFLYPGSWSEWSSDPDRPIARG